MILLLISCASATIENSDTTGYIYRKGSVVRNYRMSFDDAWAAANTALRRLNLSLMYSMKYNNTGSLAAGNASGRRAEIELVRINKDVTSIAVKGCLLDAYFHPEVIHEEIMKAQNSAEDRK